MQVENASRRIVVQPQLFRLKLFSCVDCLLGLTWPNQILYNYNSNINVIAISCRKTFNGRRFHDEVNDTHHSFRWFTGYSWQFISCWHAPPSNVSLLQKTHFYWSSGSTAEKLHEFCLTLLLSHIVKRAVWDEKSNGTGKRVYAWHNSPWKHFEKNCIASIYPIRRPVHSSDGNHDANEEQKRKKKTNNNIIIVA